MKYALYALAFFLMAVVGCADPQKKREEGDIHHLDSTKLTDNQVRSESPDATTKVEQGYALPKFDDGMAQSPINILSAQIEKDSNHSVVTEFNTEITSVENLGHTVQLNFAEGSTVPVDGKVYRFKQLHFHTPSEHLIDGMTFPMEMHIVNLSESQKDSSSYLVIGLLFKMGSENKFIKEFLSSVPAEEHKKENLPAGTVKLSDLFAGISKRELTPSYHYKGSLTTPPYTESVDWVVKRYIFEVSPEQVAAIEKIEGDNARHVHALYKRKVGGD